MMSYCKHNRDRIKKQLVINVPNIYLEENLKHTVFSAIIPQVVVCGTVTRRAIEPTWMN